MPASRPRPRPPTPPAPPASLEQGSRHGVFRFELRDADSGELIPGRLTFLGEGGPRAELFPGTEVWPSELAVRRNVVYSKSGAGAVTVPAGSYVVYASRGIEWSLTATELTIDAGTEHSWSANLRHEVDTAGYVSGDFHLHTLTYSGHGDSNVEERIISLIGEGVDFAVATDHNHLTDYGPVVEELGVEQLLGHTVGNEVSTPIGHFNTFPHDPELPPVRSDLVDARELFTLIRKQLGPGGVRPVIQLNHPRWGTIDYFGKLALDPLTAEPGDRRFSHDFDTIELLNENVGWGYHDAEFAEVPTGSSEHSVLRDWFNLLNRGYRYAAVGNSDSHTVEGTFAGYPRNYVPSPARFPGEIDVADVAAALRKRQVFTTTGPFLEFAIAGTRMGGEVRVPGPPKGERAVSVALSVRVRAATWIDCSRLKIVVNGSVARTIDLPHRGGVVRADQDFDVRLSGDAWIALIVEGDEPMEPVTTGGKRPVLPLAISNPIWVDVGGDGWTDPVTAAKAALADERSLRRLGDWGPGSGLETMLLGAALSDGSSKALIAELVRKALDSYQRPALLVAARAAERVRDPGLAAPLEAALPRTADDPYARLALLRALRASGVDVGELAADWAVLAGDRLPVHADEAERILPGRQVRDWMVLGPFAPGTTVEAAFDPEGDPAAQPVATAGLGGRDVAWSAVEASASGFLDLAAAMSAGEDAPEQVLSIAQTWVFAPHTGPYRVACGADDGFVLEVGDGFRFEDLATHGASPFQHVLEVPLKSGWNRVLFRVENAGGAHGLYFRVLHPEVAARALPR